MKSKLVPERARERTFVVILDAGEEAFVAITEFAGREKLSGASLRALGAFERAVVGWFDPERARRPPVSR
jgi:predicted DNA-binding protein with PD1-like motif